LQEYTVKQLAELSGVSIRSLHYYDEIGLLKPAHVGANGYRYYRREELLRLQQILFHRELGVSLDEIKKILDAPDFDRASALRAHRRKLGEEMQRYQRLIQTIDETLVELKGGKSMNERAFYKGLDPEKWAASDQWAIDRFGPAAAAGIKRRNDAMSTWTQADYDRRSGEFQALWSEFAKAFSQGLTADSDPVRVITRRLHGLLGQTSPGPISKESFCAVATVYAESSFLRSGLETMAAGLTDYVVSAMRAFVEDLT
jgi:DNA-binding transcriptional MerR regulator